MEEALLAQVLTLLQRQGWATYRTLRRRFHLDAPALAALTQTLLATQPVHDVDDTRLVWRGSTMLEPHTVPAPEPPAPGSSHRETLRDPSHEHPDLVGRESEVAMLHARWQQAQAGQGQVVVLRGEAGIGKSRLVQAVHAHAATHPHQYWACRCDPVAQQSALYPLSELLARVCHLTPAAAPADPLTQIEASLASYDVPLAEVVPFLADVLSVPVDGRYPSRPLTPAQRKYHTLAAIGTVLQAVAAVQPVLCVVEDLHWADPSTLELLSQLVAQVRTWPCLLLVTHRPEFQLPWPLPAHGTVLTLQRLLPAQVITLVAQRAEGQALPPFLLEEIVRRTEGVPLFVEEITRLLCTASVRQEVETAGEQGTLPTLALPTTVQESVQVRLRALGPAATAVAQVAAVWGRAVTETQLAVTVPYTPRQLEQALQRLVTADLLHEVSLPPRLTYVFKHALLQDAAYSSMPETVRRTTHARVAQVLVERFPEMVAVQPEVVAQHYTAAGQRESAVRYWQQAGQRALERSANLEAVQHLTTGLALLTTLPETSARAQQELDLQLALGPALMATKGFGAPEVEQTYTRARALCAQIGDTPQLISTLWGLCWFYQNRGVLLTAREIGEQLVRLAQHTAAPIHRLEAHEALGQTLFFLGEYAAARTHLEPGSALIDPTVQRALALRHGEAFGVRSLAMAANTLWCLGYPAQAVQRCQEALTLAQTLAHPPSLAAAQQWAAFLYYRRREALAVQAQADALLALATVQGFPLYVGLGTCWRGWALAMQGEGKAALVQLRQGMTAVLATGQTLSPPLCLALLAETAGHVGHVEEGLRLLAEALAAFEVTGRGDLLTEAYRLQGEFLLYHADMAQAETCFQQALAIACHQQAKSWELRAAMSLSRLWQCQGKLREAYDLLAPTYSWFTEGFDTADLQDAKALLEALS